MTPWVPQQKGTYFPFKKSLSHLAGAAVRVDGGCTAAFQDPSPQSHSGGSYGTGAGSPGTWDPGGHLPECASTPDLPVQVTGN